MGLCSSDAPDYTPVANATKESSEVMRDLGQQQIDFAKQQYADAKPVLSDIANAELDIMRQTQQQGQDYYDYMKGTFRPAEESLVSDVMDYNSDAKKEQLATQAAADIEKATAVQRGAEERNLMSMGVNPNSGKFAATSGQRGLQTALARAGASTRARQQAEDIGYAKKLDVVGIGRNLPGASTAAYNTATGAGNSAAGNTVAAGNQYASNFNAGVNTIGQGLNANLTGQTALLNAQIANNDNSGLWSGIGGIAQGIGYAWPSSKKLKNKLGEVDSEAVSREMEDMPVDEWEYKDGTYEYMGDSKRHVGMYAEDMEKLGAGDGKTIDVINAIGINSAALKGLGKRLSKLERGAFA